MRLRDKKASIFNKYVTTFYDERLKYEKNNSLNLVCKLLMNSLYGRLGLNQLFIALPHKVKYSEEGMDTRYLVNIKEL